MDIGTALQNEGGVISDIREAACPEGTTFLVRDLFFNAPVRRKFLKKASGETALVSDLMTRLILSRPDVSFRFVADGKTGYFSPGDGRLESAILSIYGTETLRLLTKVEGNMNGVLLDGFVGVGEAARATRAHESFFLNGRAMKSPLLSAAVEDACRQRVTIGRFPLCVLRLTMPFGAADVNVHPNKWEVRFQNEQGVREAVRILVFDALYAGQKDALTLPKLFPEDAKAMPPAEVKIADALPPIKETVLPIKETAPKPPEIIPEAKPMTEPLKPAVITRSASILPPKPVAAASFHEKPYAVSPALRALKAETPPTPPAPEQPVEPPAQVAAPEVEKRFEKVKPRVIGVVFDTYILMEYKDQLLLCDQHAAHERILYERLLRQTASAPASQTFLVPKVVKLTREDYALYEENAEALERAGFDLAPFGDGTLQMRGVPIVLGEPEAERALRDALDEMRDGGGSEDERIRRIMQMACKHAVKGGEKLPEEALAELVDRVLFDDIPPTCPHGRPLVVVLTKQELDKRFKRIQN